MSITVTCGPAEAAFELKRRHDNRTTDTFTEPENDLAKGMSTKALAAIAGVEVPVFVPKPKAVKAPAKPKAKAKANTRKKAKKAADPRMVAAKLAFDEAFAAAPDGMKLRAGKRAFGLSLNPAPVTTEG